MALSSQGAQYSQAPQYPQGTQYGAQYFQVHPGRTVHPASAQEEEEEEVQMLLS